MAQSSDIVSGQQIVIATFGDQSHAREQSRRLRRKASRLKRSRLSFGTTTTEVAEAEMDEIDRESEAVGTDVAVGGAAGGVVGFLAGLALFSIPGLGPFLGAGVLATTLGGTVLGSAAGQRTAHFNALGLPHDRAERYSGALEAGNVIVAVTGVDERTAKIAHDYPHCQRCRRRGHASISRGRPNRMTAPYRRRIRRRRRTVFVALVLRPAKYSSAEQSVVRSRVVGRSSSTTLPHPTDQPLQVIAFGKGKQHRMVGALCQTFQNLYIAAGVHGCPKHHLLEQIGADQAGTRERRQHATRT